MIERPERPALTNDNLTPADREQRLTIHTDEQRDYVNGIGEWVANQREILRAKDPFGLNPDIAQKFAALDALSEIATEVSRNIDSVERENYSDTAQRAAGPSILTLSAAYEQAIQIVGELE